MAKSKTSGGVIKPTRRELLNVAISDYIKKLRDRARTLNVEAEDLRKQANALNRSKEDRLMALMRTIHATELNRIREALKPVGGSVDDYIRRDGSATYYHYCGSVSHCFLVQEFPDNSDLDAQVAVMMERSQLLANEAGNLTRQANYASSDALFTFIASKLPAEAGELLDRLGAMIAAAMGPDESKTDGEHHNC